MKLSEHCNAVQVPFLVTSVSSNEPILGYNVIQHLLQTVHSNNAIDLLRLTLPAANEAQVNALYKELKDNEDETLGTVKVGRRNIVVPQQSSIVVSVPFKGRQLQPGCEALFVPSHQLDALGISTQEMLVEVKPNHAGRVKLLLCNPSKNDSVLSKGTLLGRFEKICSSIPFGIAGSSSDHVQTTVNQFTERCSPDTIDAIVSAVRLDEPTCSSISTPVKEAEAVEEQLIQGASLPIIDNNTLAKEQRNDEDIGTVLLWVQKGEKPTKQVTKGWSPAAKCLLREWAKLKVENGLLRREISYPREGIIQQVNEETPVYEVRKRSGQGGIRRLHRNLLRQCNSLPIESMDNDRKSCRPKKPSKQDVPVYDADSSSSDSDGFIEITEIPLNPNAKPFTPQQCRTGSDSSDSVVEVRNPTDNPVEPVLISHSSADSFQSAHSSSGLDGGEDPYLHDELVETNTPGNSDSSGTEDHRYRPRRATEVPRKLTYDQLGKPSFVQILKVDCEIFV
uniref:Uncharacterized protein n=1 Tax=Magallana gigas TaxID=29159 RepID=A0A8W8LYI6_MAGGI